MDSLNEVQFPKELRKLIPERRAPLLLASMKCSSRRNCDLVVRQRSRRRASLNEVQFPKKLRPEEPVARLQGRHASMKCSSRRNCDTNRYTAKTLQVQPQ